MSILKGIAWFVVGLFALILAVIFWRFVLVGLVITFLGWPGWFLTKGLLHRHRGHR